MSRILYWNINNFSFGKIQDEVAGVAWAADRLNYMVQSVMRGPVGGPIPDIIVIVEVYSRVPDTEAEGLVLSSVNRAGQAVLLLLAELRGDPVLGAGTNWCVVPPINLGAFFLREAVAVFFNANNIQFTGPNLLYPYRNDNAIKQSQAVNAATAAVSLPYSVNWHNALPALGRSTAFPGVAAPIPENRLAGEWQYFTPPRPVPSFPTPWNFPANRIKFPYESSRGPFYTRFLDLSTPAPHRTINLFSVHTSPGSAVDAVLNMQEVPEMAAVGANQVNVILGDFNVDSFQPDGWAYNWLADPDNAGIYTMALDPRVPGAAVSQVRKPYCMTHLLPTDDATPFNALGIVNPDPQHNVYPRFGYLGTSFNGINNSGAIDNVFTVYGAGLVPPVNNHITVVNTLTGTPYSLVPAPPGVSHELFAGLNFAAHFFPNLLTATPPAYGIDSFSATAAAETIVFRHWTRYGVVRSTSDHLPLMIDV